MTRAEIKGLYAITPDISETSSLISMARQVLAGGARLIQYRNKAASAALKLEQAHSLADLCRKFHASLIINDHLDLAVEVNADGVHLGGEDSAIFEARRALGAGKIVGASCYNCLELAFEAEREGADYVAFGAFFTSATKPKAVMASLDLLRHGRTALHIPMVAIGGITPDTAAGLIQAGATAVAVSGGLFGVSDIRSAAATFAGLFKQL